jgi:hypothetical protein
VQLPSHRGGMQARKSVKSGRARPGRGAGRAKTAQGLPVSRPPRRGWPPAPQPAGPAVPRRGTNRKNGRGW